MSKIRTTKTNRYLRMSMVLLVLACLMLAAMLPAVTPARASTTFTVNSAADFADINVGDSVCDADFATGNLCTLRAAISKSNAIAGEDVINFNIPGTGVKTISPQTNLPNIIDPVTIDGFTQTGASPNSRSKGTNAKLMIELNGSGVTGTFESTGQRLSAPNSTVQGLVINRFVVGVSIFAQGVTLQENFIGTDPSGSLDRGNSLGVFHQGSQALIGGNFPQDANLISGNDGAGISIRSLASGNVVVTNVIGTDRSGTKRLGNSDAGVELTGSSGNFVEDNTIAFNGEEGVKISDDPGNPANHIGNNTIASNSIFSNGGLGINLVDPSALVPVGSSEGPTANDTGDGDIGPNGLQNFPVVTSAETLSDKTVIKARPAQQRSQRTIRHPVLLQPSRHQRGQDVHRREDRYVDQWIGQRLVHLPAHEQDRPGAEHNRYRH